MLRRSPTTAGAACAAALSASGWVRERGGKHRPVCARSGVYTCETPLGKAGGLWEDPALSADLMDLARRGDSAAFGELVEPRIR